MKTKTALCSLLLCAQLSACTMIPHYLQPDMPVTKTWDKRMMPEPVSEDASKAMAAIGWKQFFVSEPLRQVIETTLENNRDLRTAALNVQAAQALYRVQRADLLPGVDAAGSSTRQKITEAQAGTEYISSTYTANLASTAFELDLFGRIRSENKAALETYFASASARDAVQVSLVAEVANAYLQWLADRKILKLTNETLQTQEKSYELINASYKKGVASKLDLAQVRTAVETARSNKALYQRYVMQDKNALLLLMGNTPKDGLPKATLDSIELMQYLPTDLTSEVLLMRPDVQEAEHQLKADNANIGAARAAFFPTISLTGSYGYASSDMSDLFSSAASGAWSFVPRITLPIFQGGRNIANLDYSKLKKEASVAQYEKTIQTAFKEVADELAAYATLDDEIKARKALVEATQESYDLSYARYKHGIDSFLNVLDAQRSLFSAQQQEIEVEKQRLANLVNLYKVLGGGVLDDTKEETKDKTP